MNYFLILLLTIIIEFFIYLIFIRKNILNLLLYSVLINSLTNPLANFMYQLKPWLFSQIFIIELGVFVMEIFFIKFLFEISWKKAILISLVANLASFIFGIIVF